MKVLKYILIIPESSKLTRDQILITQFKEYLKQSLGKNERITVGKAAKSILVSVPHLYKSCKKVLKKSPRRIIVEEIINKANHMHMIDGLSEAEISDRLGFADESSYCHFFKKNTGYTYRSYLIKNKLI